MKAVKKTKATGTKSKMAKYMKAQDGMTVADKKAKKEADLEAKKKANKEAAEDKAASNERKAQANKDLASRTKTNVAGLNSALSDYRALTPAERDGAKGAELQAQIKEIRENMRGGSLPGVQVAPTGKLRPGVLTGESAVDREKRRKKIEARG
jgi:hypothetical protein